MQYYTYIMEKVAFLFLTQGDLNKSEMWRRFFQDAPPSQYNIYVHNSKPITHGWLRPFGLKTIVDTQWGTISLVKATRLLLQQAVRHPSNKRFVLLSESCIPIYAFDEVYARAMRQPVSCIASVKATGDHLRKRWEKVADKSRLPLSDFCKHHQWFMLNRDTAIFFADADLSWVFADVEAPDEHYFLNACRMFNIPVRPKQITYVDWTNRRIHPHTFRVVEKDIIAKARASGCLFLRKVHWRTAVDERYALQQV